MDQKSKGQHDSNTTMKSLFLGPSSSSETCLNAVAANVLVVYSVCVGGGGGGDCKDVDPGPFFQRGFQTKNEYSPLPPTSQLHTYSAT